MIRTSAHVRWMILLVVGLWLAGCGSDKKKMPSLDVCTGDACYVEADGEVALPDVVPDVEDVIPELPPAEITPEVEVVHEIVFETEVTPPPPVLTFCVMTAVGCLESVQLELDLDKHDLNDAVPGLQVKVQVHVENIPMSTPIELWVDDLNIETKGIASSEFDFNEITLSQALAPDCHEMEVRIPPPYSVSEQKLVCAETGSCGIKLTPSNDLCLSADEDPATAGFQALFTVANQGTDCDIAWIDGDVVATDQTGFEDGQAEIMVTMVEQNGEQQCAQLEVVAHVSDSNAPEREETVTALFTVDTASPSISIVSPVAGTVNLTDDEDGNADNGLQLNVLGSVSGIGALDIVELWVNDQLTDTTIGGDGQYTFENVTFIETGLYTLEARAEDCCGNQASDQVAVVAILGLADLIILSPMTGAVLLAVDDDVPATTSIYDTQFLVQAPALEVGDELDVQCRKNQVGSIWANVGSLVIAEAVADGIYAVDVDMDVALVGNLSICRARYVKESTTVSPLVNITVALPPPSLVVQSPADGDSVEPSEFQVAGSATNLKGRPVTVQLIEGQAVIFEDSSTSASDSGFLFSKALEGVPDDAYTLHVSATDAWGNDAADQADSVTELAIVLDSQAPTLAFAAPLDGFLCNLAACPDTIGIMPGVQIEASVQVLGELKPETVSVCLTANSVPIKPCIKPTPDGGIYYGQFFGITLLSGENVFSATATDELGHQSEAVTVTGTFDINAPRVTFVAPPADLVTAQEPVTVIISVASPDALTPLEGASVTLFVGGQPFVTDQPTNADGTVEFKVDGLVAGVPLTLQAAADHVNYTETGYSDFRKVTLKETAPSIEIIDPPNPSLINAATPGCAAGVAGCKMPVTATTMNVEDGAEATLNVDCPGQDVSFTEKATVQDNSLTFTGVTLPDNSVCTLVAQVTDLAGQTAASDPVEVTVDRTPPEVLEFTAPYLSLVPIYWDEQPTVDGYQYTVKVVVSGVPAQQQIVLDIVPEEGAADSLSLTVQQEVPDGQSKEFAFAQYTFEGQVLYTLTCSVSDLAGNTGTLSFQVEFFTEETDVYFDVLNWVDNDKTCASNADCGIGICAPADGGNRCVTPWKLAPHGFAMFTEPPELFDGQQNLRLCSNHPEVSEAAALCDYSEEGVYRAVKLVNNTGGAYCFSLTQSEVAALPQGTHTMILEAVRNDTEEWLGSMQSTIQKGKYRVVLVDTDAPQVDSVTFTADIVDPTDVLSLAEVNPESADKFPVLIAVSDGDLSDGTVKLTVNGADKGVFPIVNNQVEASLKLVQGANQVCALASDLVGNTSAPKCETVTVDTVAPSLGFGYPTTSPLLAGADLDVVLISDAIGQTVTLENFVGGDYVELATAQVSAQGMATFADVLSDGSWQLRATVADAALNETPVLSQPAVIVVDTSPPTVTITTPENGTAFAEEDDEDQLAGGFQLDVLFQTTDTATFAIETQRCPDDMFAGCEPAKDKTPPAEGVQDLGNGEFLARITLGGLLLPTEYRIVRVTVQDENGNVASHDVEVTLALNACTVQFTNLPESGWVNNAVCDPAGMNCDNAALLLNMEFAGACGDVDLVVLFLDDNIEDSVDQWEGNTVPFELAVAHGDAFAVEARLYFQGAETGGTTGVFDVTVDLHGPVPSFVAPDSDPFICNIEADLNGSAPGCQTDVDVAVEGDSLVGVVVSLVRTDQGQEAPIDDVVISAEPFAHQFASITLPAVDGEQLVLRAVDEAGNAGEAVINTTVDVTAPSAVDLNSVNPAEDVNRRRPSVRLTWTAVGDDAGEGQASGYEFRYSFAPIQNKADFQAACDPTLIVATGDPAAPAESGALESFDITGLDTRSPADPCYFGMSGSSDFTVYFAARAVDDVGNTGPIAADNTTSTTDLALKYAQISGGDIPSATMGSAVASVGDINGDSMAEFAVGGGAPGFHGFCIVKGHTETEAVIDLSDDTDPNVSCIEDASSSWLGASIVGLGDVNGDGYRDVGAVVYDAAFIPGFRVYLGNSAGFVDETPAVLFLMTAAGDYYANMTSAGNFNGDKAGAFALNDIAIALPGTNKVFVIPGSAAWNSDATTEINLLNAGDLTAWSVVTVSGVAMPAGAFFGNVTAGVGNVLLDNDGEGTQYDDLAIARSATPGSSAYLLMGRATVGAEQLTISDALDGQGTEDTVTVKLIPNAGYDAKDLFGNMMGAADVDSDGIPDVRVWHPNNGQTSATQTYFFFGSVLNDNLGAAVQMGAGSAAGDGVVKNTVGLRLPGNYTYFAMLGNFDNASVGAGKSWDLAYTDYNTFVSFGTVYVRLSHAGVAGAADIYPYAQLAISNPFDPGSTQFGGYGIAGLGDSNGDGLPDLLVGNTSLGYAVLAW